jgi:pyruvate/2-oxoglutarate dehydrogenase complex dihydrolipoamide acyltransferase (E2) component
LRADRWMPREFLSPAVRHIAAQRGLDLAALASRTGSGLNGRLTVADLDREPPPTATSERITLGRLRARAARNLVQAKAAAAHAWVALPADYTRIDQARRDTGLTALPFVARAVVDALAANPLCNATVRDGIATSSASVHLGIAVDLDHQGLIVPVVHDAQDLRLRALGRTIRELAAKARSSSLTPGDVTGATFTITNPGARGTYLSVPVIPAPQVAILSTDGIAKRVVVSERGDVGVRWIGMLGLSFDHRVLSAHVAAAFLASVAHTIGTRDWRTEL